MDIGDLLNILLAVIVIVIAILLALHLPKIAYGASGQENPFAIYQIAISLNYFSSFPGEFNIKISYPGIEQCEFRIATFHRDEKSGKVDKGNSYVSEGFCSEKNHLKDIGFDILSALSAAVPIDIPGLGKGASMGKLVIGTIIRAGKIFFWRQVISFLATVAMNIMSGNPLDLFSSFIRRVAKERLRYFAQIAAEKGMEFAQILIEVVINVVVRYVLKFTGLLGYAVSFGLNLLIGLWDNIYDVIRGWTDVTYNCLRGFQGETQYVYIEFDRVYYSQNMYVPLKPQDKRISNIKLAELTEGWLYKVSMSEKAGDNKLYVLSEVIIYTKDNSIWIEPNYQEIIKQ